MGIETGTKRIRSESRLVRARAEASPGSNDFVPFLVQFLVVPIAGADPEHRQHTRSGFPLDEPTPLPRRFFLRRGIPSGIDPSDRFLPSLRAGGE